jgi:hypothetical protein
MDEVRDVVTDLSSVAVENLPAETTEHRSAEQEGLDQEEEPQLTRGRYAQDTSGFLITGQMSLYEIEVRTGVSVRLIAQRLGLPSGAPLGERLGRLRKVYSFTMLDVRDAVASLIREGGNSS